MRDINIYLSFDSWAKEAPDAVIRGSVRAKNDYFIEIQDENGYTQLINLSRLYAIVY